MDCKIFCWKSEEGRRRRFEEDDKGNKSKSIHPELKVMKKFNKENSRISTTHEMHDSHSDTFDLLLVQS